MRRIASFAVRVGLACLAAGQVVRAQNSLPDTHSNYFQSLEDTKRSARQKPDEVVDKFGLKPGNAGAELRAGSGYFTMRFAKAVGPQGRVYTVDILPEMLDYIRQRAQADGVKNIELVRALPNNPLLPSGSVDMVFICNTLHHISDRPAYYPLLVKALRPNGRLVNLDFYKRPLPLGPPPPIKIDKQDMIDEAKSAGLHVVQDFDFLPYQYFLIFQH